MWRTYVSLATFLVVLGVFCNDVTLKDNTIVGSQLLSGIGITPWSNYINIADRSGSGLGKRQTGGDRCGTNFQNQQCGPNLCCSFYGYCGTGEVFCTAIAGCQTGFGYCG